MRVHEMKEMSPEDLQASIIDTRKELVQLRFQLAARKLESPAKLRQARQKLSRLITIQHQKALKDQKPARPEIARSVRTKLHRLETGTCSVKESTKSSMTRSVARRIKKLKTHKATVGQ